MDKNSDNIAGRNVKDVFNRPAKPIVGVDVEKYKVFLDDPALTETQKEEFLQALWSIMVTFVELGFGVHPLQSVYKQDDEHPAKLLGEEFDKAGQSDSNGKNNKDGGLPNRPEIE